MSERHSTDHILVVGAGISGLSLAAEVAQARPTTVIDRLPVVGGTTMGFEHPAVLDTKHRCDAAGVRFMLGTTALRWSQSHDLLATEPINGAQWLKAGHLAFAGGVRPSTVAELQLLGDRVAGVFPASYAYHLMDSGVRLGRRVVVIGAGTLAQRVATQVVRQDMTPTIVTQSGEPCGWDACPALWWAGWHPTKVIGDNRVNGLVVAKDDIEQHISCDAVILAADMRPLRNVDGAIYESPNNGSVTFVQDVADVFSIKDRIENALSKARTILRTMSETLS